MREELKLKSGRKLSIFLVVLLLSVFGGCVSTPQKGQLQQYSISGAAYFSLVSLCDLKSINWDYDLLTRTAELNKANHRIKLQSGRKTIYVDGSPKELSEPVDLYKGMLVVPGQFRQLVEGLFPDFTAPAETVSFYNIRKVIIDPGHGGKDPGAPGRFGLQEKDVVLDISRRLNVLLRQYGVETVMTRSTDRFIPLESRAALTDNSRADLFISIHANANPARSMNGFEVYYISPEVSDYKRALASARYSCPEPDSASFSGLNSELKAILWDMTYTYNRGASIQLSKDICRSIGQSQETRVIGVKSANYCVLRGSRIPAVLVEVGFLSNGAEERLLNDPQHRQKIAEAIERGIQSYDRQVSGGRTDYIMAKSKEGIR